MLSDKIAIYGLVQDCSNSSAVAMELLQLCTKPSTYCLPLNDSVSPSKITWHQLKCPIPVTLLLLSNNEHKLHSMNVVEWFLATCNHDDVIKWKHFPCYWPFLRGIHQVSSPHKGQWRGALMLSLICARINSWVNNREAGDLRRHRAHYDGIVMWVLYNHNILYVCETATQTELF